MLPIDLPVPEVILPVALFLRKIAVVCRKSAAQSARFEILNKLLATALSAPLLLTNAHNCAIIIIQRGIKHFNNNTALFYNNPARYDMDLELLGDRSEKINYSFTDFPIHISRMLVADHQCYAVPAHFHDDIELIALRTGEINYNVNGEVVKLKSGEGIIVNSRQMHFSCGNDGIQHDMICILLNPMLLCSITAFEQEFILPVIKRGAAYVKLRPDIPWQKDILDIVEKLYGGKETKTAPLKAQGAFAYILALIMENAPPSGSGKNRLDGDLSIIKNMVSFIQQRYAEKISLGEIAAAGAVGQSKCCKLFAKYLAQTPNGYLNQYRLSKSTELLENTDMSVTRIAEATGFGGASYYAEVFGKFYGKSPSAYRSSKEQN